MSTKINYNQIKGAVVNVLDYGINTTPGTTDMTSAITAAIAAAGAGGTVYFPQGFYKTTSMLSATDLRGLTLRGEKGQYGWVGSQITGVHTGNAILSLVGSQNCRIQDLILAGDTTTSPKTGLLLGRSSSASAGGHLFDNITIRGTFSLAGVYNVCSEENTWLNPFIAPNADYAGMYIAQNDSLALAVGGLTTSSMESNWFYGGVIGNASTAATSAGIYINMGAATGHIHFHDTFISRPATSVGGSYVRIVLQDESGSSPADQFPFPIGFYDVVGEAASAPGPDYGFRVSSLSASAAIMSGFKIINSRFSNVNAGFFYDDYVALGKPGVQFIGAEISEAWRNSGTATFVASRFDNSNLTLLQASAITIGTVNGTVINSNAVPTITTGVANQLHSVTASTIGRLVQTVNSPAYGASIAINAQLATFQAITITNGTGFTIQNPTNPIASQMLTFQIINSSGGAHGVITWDTNFRLAGALGAVATGTNRSITFKYNGTVWHELYRTAADVTTS